MVTSLKLVGLKRRVFEVLPFDENMATKRKYSSTNSSKKKARTSKIARYVKKGMGLYGSLAGKSYPELKYFDVSFDAVPVSTTASTSCLNSIGAGTDAIQRTGRSIRCKSVQVRGSVVCADTYNVIRAILYYDKQQNNSASVGTDLIQDGLGATDVYSSINLNNRDRYVVLRDELMVLGSTSSTGLPDVKTIEWYVKMPSVETRFLSTSASYPETGGLNLMFISDSGAVAHPTYSFRSRLRYVDN